jgi:hypothetical protein
MKIIVKLLSNYLLNDSNIDLEVCKYIIVFFNPFLTQFELHIECVEHTSECMIFINWYRTQYQLLMFQ